MTNYSNSKKTKQIVYTVCWKCKRMSVTLKKCLNKLDYVCVDCVDIVGIDGPEIGNQSKKVYTYE